MPLGFAQSNLGLPAVAAGEPGLAGINSNDSYFLTGSVTTNASDVAGVTISFWFRHTASHAAADNNAMFRLTGGSYSVLGAEYQGGRIRFINRNNGGSGDWAFDYLIGTYNGGTYGNGTYDDGNWHHVVFSRNGSTKAVYVDGSSVTVTTNAGRENFAVDGFEGAVYGTVNIMNEEPSGTTNVPDIDICQLFVDDSYYDLSTHIGKFYDSGGTDGAVDMGTDGTSSGLTQPVVFHQGDTSTFDDKGGDTSTFNYGVTVNGTGLDISTSNGPQF